MARGNHTLQPAITAAWRLRATACDALILPDRAELGVLEDDGSAEVIPEELYVVEHPSLQEILDQMDDLIDRKSSGEIDHRLEYVAVPPVEEDEAREAVDVRLVRVGGARAGAREWRKDLDVAKLPGLAPRLPWLAEIDRILIKTWLKAALQAGEQDGQEFTLPSDPSYRDFDHVIEFATPSRFASCASRTLTRTR